MKLLFVGLSAFALSACVVIHASPDTLMPAGSEKVTLNDFSGIELRGGGDIEIEHGAEFTFTDTGDRHDWKIGIEKGNLVLKCDNPCTGRGRRSALITLPELENISLKGGGEIDVEGDFPDVRELNIAIHGGGDIDASDVRADEVNVSIMGGGEVDVHAVDELNVSIMGGGQINYRGTPEIHKSVLGGGGVYPLSGS